MSSVITNFALFVICFGAAFLQSQTCSGNPESKTKLSEKRELLHESRRLMASGPCLRFISTSEAEVEFQAMVPCSAELRYGPVSDAVHYSQSVELDQSMASGFSSSVASDQKKISHKFILRNLEYRKMYGYQIAIKEGKNETLGAVYAFDNSLNYNLTGPESNRSEKAGSRHIFAETVLNNINSEKGFCIVLGATDANFLESLASRSGLSITCVDESQDAISKLRNTLYKKNIYGKRLKTRSVNNISELPFPSKFANLVLIQDLKSKKRPKEILAESLRIIRPAGGTCLIKANSSDSTLKAIVQENAKSNEYSIQTVTENGFEFIKIKRSILSNGGSWTHQYGDTENSSNSNGTLAGKSSTDQLQVQWFGIPGGDFGLDRNPRMPAPVAINGNLFHQGMNRIAAIDSYNGTILWSAEIPGLRRVNIPRDCSNWCADEKLLYVAVKDRLWVMDQLTGSIEATVQLPINAEKHDYDWGYIAQKGDMFYGSAVKKNSSYTGYWGNSTWYDSQAGSGAFKIVSRELYGFNKKDSKPAWKFSDGVMINPAIAISGEYLFAVCSNSEPLKGHISDQTSSEDLWKNLSLLCLNRKTGSKIWKRKINTVPGLAVFFLQCSKDLAIIESSASGKYHLYAYDKVSGDNVWHAEHNWPSDNHSGHMQHPVIVGDKIFLEPCGYDLNTGKLITSKMGRHEGCTTYCGTMDALIYRGTNRRISMWDIENGRVTNWMNLRPSCWLSTVPADGMLLAPEGGGGCSCGNWFETSVVFAPCETENKQNE
jgi:outer membrane protein assembly factor BamB